MPRKISTATVEQAVAMLLAGASSTDAAKQLNINNSTLYWRLKQAGMLFNRKTNTWSRATPHPEPAPQPAVGSEGWNLPLDDYQALLAPRDRTASRNEDDANGRHEIVVEPQPPLISLQSDPLTVEAVRLLRQAATQRRIDQATIAALESTLRQTQIDLARAELEQRRAQSENHRLHDEIKREISRGILQSSVDDLRDALA